MPPLAEGVNERVPVPVLHVLRQMRDEVAEDEGQRDGSAQCFRAGRHGFIREGGDEPLDERALPHAGIGEEDGAGLRWGEVREERRGGILPFAQCGVECLGAEMRLRAGGGDEELADGELHVLLALFAVALGDRKAEIFVDGELVEQADEVAVERSAGVERGSAGLGSFLLFCSSGRGGFLRFFREHFVEAGDDLFEKLVRKVPLVICGRAISEGFRLNGARRGEAEYLVGSESLKILAVKVDWA